MNFSISYNLGSFLFVIIRSTNGEYIRAHERHTAVALLIPMAALHKPEPEMWIEGQREEIRQQSQFTTIT